MLNTMFVYLAACVQHKVYIHCRYTYTVHCIQHVVVVHFLAIVHACNHGVIRQLTQSFMHRLRVCLSVSLITVQYIYELKGHSAAVRDVRFCHNDKHIVTASDNGTLRLWVSLHIFVLVLK